MRRLRRMELSSSFQGKSTCPEVSQYERSFGSQQELRHYIFRTDALPALLQDSSRLRRKPSPLMMMPSVTHVSAVLLSRLRGSKRADHACFLTKHLGRSCVPRSRHTGLSSVRLRMSKYVNSADATSHTGELLLPSTAAHERSGACTGFAAAGS